MSTLEALNTSAGFECSPPIALSSSCIHFSAFLPIAITAAKCRTLCFSVKRFASPKQEAWLIRLTRASSERSSRMRSLAIRPSNAAASDASSSIFRFSFARLAASRARIKWLFREMSSLFIGGLGGLHLILRRARVVPEPHFGIRIVRYAHEPVLPIRIVLKLSRLLLAKGCKVS